MPLDPQAGAYLERLEQLGVRPVEQLTPADARKQAERGASFLFGPVERVASVSELDTDGVASNSKLACAVNPSQSSQRKAERNRGGGLNYLPLRPGRSCFDTTPTRPELS